MAAMNANLDPLESRIPNGMQTARNASHAKLNHTREMGINQPGPHPFLMFHYRVLGGPEAVFAAAGCCNLLQSVAGAG
jgi:hypothetical protein